MGKTQDKQEKNLAVEAAMSPDENKGGAQLNGAAQSPDVREDEGGMGEGQVNDEGQANQGRSPEDKEQRYADLMAALPLSNQEKFKHKREQVYLMVMMDLSDAFIRRALSLPFLTIDRVRMAVMIAGEEKVFRFLSETPDPDINEDSILGMLSTVYPENYKEPRQPEKEAPVSIPAADGGLDVMGSYMVRQQKIASDQMNRLLAYAERINDLFANKAKEDVEDARRQQADERANYQKKIDALEDENFRLNMELAQENARKDLLEKEAAETSSGEKAKEQPANAGGRQGREDKKREAFVSALFSDNRFNEEQISVIGTVIKENLSLAQLKKICNPKVPARNMLLLAAYYRRRQ